MTLDDTDERHLEPQLKKDVPPFSDRMSYLDKLDEMHQKELKLIEERGEYAKQVIRLEFKVGNLERIRDEASSLISRLLTENPLPTELTIRDKLRALKDTIKIFGYKEI